MANPHELQSDHIRELSSRFALGPPAGAAERVYGGFHHKMWRLESGGHSYAVKQLSAYTDLRDPDVVAHYNVSERVADALAARGIPAVAALRIGADYLQVVDDTGYLVYPWCRGAALPRTQLDESHALKIARLVANMHRAQIDVPGVRQTRFDPHPTERIEPLLLRTRDCPVLASRQLFEHRTRFAAINDACPAAAKKLRRHMVIGHGDMDQKNVLWDEQHNPFIIDWESTRQLNPTFELVNMGLDWSGISSGFDAGLFSRTLAAYQESGGIIEADFLQPALACIKTDWLIWLLYITALCLDRDDLHRREVEAAQIDMVAATLLRLDRLSEQLLDIARSAIDG